MSDKLRYNNHSVIIARRVRALFNKINRDQSLRDRSDIRSRTGKLLESFRELYTNLGKSTIEARPFEPRQVPRSEQLNLTMQEVEQDLTIAYDEVGSLRNGFVETFNHAQAASSDLLLSSQNIASKVIDLRLLAGQQDQNILVAGDDFTTLTRVDQNIGLQNTQADVLLDQGAVTLFRSLSHNVVNENTSIKVTPIGPQDMKTLPTVNNINRFYEGNFYNYIGDARPEGGRFHLEETMSVNVEEQGVAVTDVNNINGVINIATAQADHLQNALDRLGDPEAPPGPGEALRPEDIIVYDRGASEGEKRVIRRNMIDENPSSIWECEYVRTEPAIQQAVEEANTIGLDTQSTVLEGPAGEQYPLDNIPMAVTLDDLRTQASGFSQGDDDDLVVEIILTLDKPQKVNWISLIPNNFEETAWIDVLDDSVSVDGQSTFRQIPGFNDAVHDNILTDDANAELTDQEAGALLAPDRYAYRGTGVWNFDAVVAAAVRVRLRQRTATPAPYQRLAIRLHRVFTQTTTQIRTEN